MSPPRKLSDEEAADFALSMTQFERDVMTLCSKDKSWRYPRIAEKLGASYAEVQVVGRKFQALCLARVSVIPYDGSAIFLNDSGESVKVAVEALARLRANRNPAS